jgi:RNA polymerase sigma-70 factor (ECF subfamily)
MPSLDSLYSYALMLTRRRADADDLLQEALLRAFRRFETFDQTLSFKAWAFTIIKHTHIDHQRRHPQGCAVALPGDGGHGVDIDAEEFSLGSEQFPLFAIPLDPENILLRGEVVAQVREAIRRLPREFREVVELRDIEGLSYREIAHVIERPLGTVMSRLYRGRNLLRTYLVEPKPETRGQEARHGL